MNRLIRTFALAFAVAMPLAASADTDPFAGVTIEALGSSETTLPDGRVLVFLRITMDPGASIPAHSHPGDVVVVVDGGAFTTEFTQGRGTLARYGQDAQAIVPGTAHVLTPGDSLAYGGASAHTMVNAGDEPVVLLVAALLDPSQDGFLFHDHHASH